MSVFSFLLDKGLIQVIMFEKEESLVQTLISPFSLNYAQHPSEKLTFLP